MTHTYAVLDVSPQTFDEVAKKLREAGYDHVFIDDVIDMHGIALKADVKSSVEHPPPSSLRVTHGKTRD